MHDLAQVGVPGGHEGGWGFSGQRRSARADLVQHDPSWGVIPDLVKDKVNLDRPDQLRRLPKVTVKFIDGNLGDQGRRHAAARLDQAPEDAAVAHPGANGFGQGAFGWDLKTRVRVLLV